MADDHEEEIHQLVRPEEKPHVDGEIPPHSPGEAATVAKVLDDDNLLREILVRVGFPTTLVCAALVCKRWLGHASNPKFLSRSRKLNPPRLLGYYITEWSVSLQKLLTPRFVPVLPQPPELAIVIRRAESYNFDGHDGLHRMDCRSGSIFTERSVRGVLTHVVHLPLCPQRSMNIVPPLPSVHDHSTQKYDAILSKDEGSGLSYFYLLGESTQEVGKSMAHVYMLQDGIWRMLNSAPCLHGLHFDPQALLFGNKIYMPTASGDDIIVLDLTASSFSTIQLSKGVKYYYFKSILSRADDASSVHLIHVEGFQLSVWLHKGDNWLLVDTICLREMLSTLGMSGHNLRIRQVGENGQFVFFQMGQHILCLDIKCRTFSEVHENSVNDRDIGYVHPFMMIWPPTFPDLKDDPAKFVF